MKLLQGLLLLTSFFLIAAPAPAEEARTEIRHRPGDAAIDKRFEYFIELLHLTLEKTREEYGNYSVAPAEIPINQARAFQLAAEGKYIDVVWSMTSRERETKTRPIRIPLLKGLLGHRVLLVREEALPEFARVHSREDLAEFVGIQGHDWPDTTILKANGLNIVTSSNYETMFKMLDSSRVDYFPRSVAEVWPEIKAFEKEQLVAAPNAILVYSAPIYFFVNRDNTELAERITLGLERAINDGSFDRLFYSREEIKAGLEFLKNSNYSVIRLVNPELTPETPLDNPKLWLQLPLKEPSSTASQ